MPSKKQTRDQRRKAVAASRMLTQGSQPESFEDFLAAITGEPQGEIRQMQRYQPAPMSMPELLSDPMLQEKPMQRHRLEMPQSLPRAQPMQQQQYRPLPDRMMQEKPTRQPHAAFPREKLTRARPAMSNQPQTLPRAMPMQQSQGRDEAFQQAVLQLMRESRMGR